ncbi:MAG: formylglycine-generating enzyme family protein [Myxococcales bacterium]|nr:formylglycine-generating enzyme family protein [Myxococcales bacterium]
MRAASMLWIAGVLGVVGCAEGGGGAADARRGQEEPPEVGREAGPPEDAGVDAGPWVCTPGERSSAPCPAAGVCAGTQAVCTPMGQFGPCDLPPVYEADETTCDGLDNDCDGRADEAWPGIGRPCDSEDADRCALGQLRCTPDGTGAFCADDEPVFETCNGRDDDCDDAIDEDSQDAPPARLQAGLCVGLRMRCGPDGEGFIEPDYSAIPGYEAFEESCDGLDNDCDGRVDQGLFPPPFEPQAGVCVGLQQICGGPAGWTPPDLGAVPGHEDDEVTCDGLDNDCDGAVDEAVVPPACPLVEGVCVAGAPPPACLGAAGFAACDYGPDHEPDEQDTCDALDNDCDGTIDEGAPCPVDRQAVRVEAGRFTMGSPPEEPGRDADEEAHDVELTRALLVRRTEVTQAEWLEVLGGENPARFPGADRPVEQVAWPDALRFLNALSAREGLPACYPDGAPVFEPDCPGWRLPTEAEWEYITRAGGPVANLDAVAWHRGNSAESTHPVARKAADRNGIHDLLGNVSEWVFDAYGPYPAEAVDPVVVDGASRVARGGSYATLAARVRVANRIELAPAARNPDVGLRPVRTAPEAP